MCGYAFLLSTEVRLRSCYRPLLERVSIRGRDSQSMIRIGDADMFHARLSIIDIEHGSQPLSAHDSFLNHHILFNGEIYNHNEFEATAFFCLYI